MKFGKLPVKTFIIGILEYKGLKNSLFKKTNPNKRANNNKLNTTQFFVCFFDSFYRIFSPTPLTKIY